jgi:hypothetical protein
MNPDNKSQGTAVIPAKAGIQVFENPHPSLSATEIVSQCTNGPYLSSRVEREILLFQLRAKKDFSPLARNDNCDTVSRRARVKIFFSPKQSSSDLCKD